MEVDSFGGLGRGKARTGGWGDANGPGQKIRSNEEAGGGNLWEF